MSPRVKYGWIIEFEMDVNILHPQKTDITMEGSRSSPKNDAQHRNLKLFCKQRLKNRVFLGHFQEKRYVERLNTYKDLVIVGADEKEFCADIQSVCSQARNQFGPDIWVGFTGPEVIGAPAGHCIWAAIGEMEPSMAFGRYWFQVGSNFQLINQQRHNSFFPFVQIKTVRFKEREIEIQLTVLRPAEITDSNSSFATFVTEELPKVEWGKLLVSWKNAINHNSYQFLKEQVTAANIVAALKFIGLLTVVVVGGLFYSLKYVGEFTLRFMNEVSKLIRAMTPVMMGTLDVFQRIVGGFYMLLAMMWGDTVGKPRSPNRNRIDRARYPALAPPRAPYSRANAVLYR